MTDPRVNGTPASTPIGGRSSGRWLAALVALAFVAGLTLTGYAARRWSWFNRADAGAPPVATPEPVETAIAGSEPAAPLSMAPPLPDPATLATREAALAGQLAALETRAAQLAADTAAAGAQAGRAEAILVVAAARRQVDAGQPLGYLEEQLRQRFGERQPRAVAVLVDAARRPVTLDQLAIGLDGLGNRLAVAPQDDILDMLRHELATLVVIRRAGAASPLPGDRLADARQALLRGRVDTARTIVADLPGASAARGWLAMAGRWSAAHRALEALDTAALTVTPPVPTTTVTLSSPTTTVLP